MSDLIKREDAIRIMACEMYAEAQAQGYEVDSLEDFIPEAKAWMNDAPSADRPQGWIPCSERMPKARESVLLAVNHKCGDWVGEGCYWETTDNHIIWKGYRWNATYWDDEIIAWMPLPKPWKGADDE